MALDWVKKSLGFNSKISGAAAYFGPIFQERYVEYEFYNSVVSSFINFDDSNGAEHNRLFSKDIEYIVACTIEDFTSSKNSQRSSQRIESYFYIYHRIAQYINMSKQTDTMLIEFQQKLFEFLTSKFKDTNGQQPNILLKERDILQEINIYQHLSSVAITNEQQLRTAFVLFKLSIQSSLVLHGHHNRLKWKDMLSKVQEIKLSIEDFVKQYITYQVVFQECRLDIPGSIYLIEKIHPLKSSKTPSFITFTQFAQKINLNYLTFLKELQPLFENYLKYQSYDDQHIRDLLLSLSPYDDSFLEYLTIYSSNVVYDNVWKMFLDLSKSIHLTEIMRKHLSTVLTQRISSVSLAEIRKYIASAKEYLRQIKQEVRPYFIEIFERVYDAFVLKEIQNKGYSNRLMDRNLKELLSIDTSFVIPSNHFTRPSNLLIIQQLLFTVDISTRSVIPRIQRLFENLKEFDVNICQNHHPVGIIVDEWLKDFLLIIPQDWIKLDKNDYALLCSNHGDNQWTIHSWSRIVHLSLSKTAQDNLNVTLSKLNEWMKMVGHDVYQPNDILTIIFVKYVFETIIIRYTKSIILLPNIETIIKFVIAIKERQPAQIDTRQVEDFVRQGSQELERILRLQGQRSIYRELMNSSIIRCFLPTIDLETILTSIQPPLYRFPQTTARIDSIISLRKPNDIDSRIGNSKEEFIDRFVKNLTDWFAWFDKFIDVFQPIIEWLKTYNITRAIQLSSDLNRIKNDPKVSVIQLKTFVEEMFRVLAPFNDLRRLCYLFNCLTSFRIIDRGALNNQINVMNFIKDSESFHQNDTFTVEGGNDYEHRISITDHQNVDWSLASKTHACNIQIQYQTDENDQHVVLYENDNAPIHRNLLHGQFETERSGQLILKINNRQSKVSHVLWYRIRLVNLSTCHLFHGILNMNYKQFYGESYQNITEKNLSELIDLTFKFIDKLLNGSLTLKEMDAITIVFCDKNIHIREEVEKLFASRSTEQLTNQQEIEQVCEWLQIYQYYSHISIIIDCMAKFDILYNENDDESIGHLQRLGGNENCNLREITQAYRILQQQFQNLTNQHLQLIKTVLECSNVVHMMKKEDLYSDQGRSRFQELRDNLTTQFQLQDKNNMILNAWIMTYTLIEPFVHKVKKFDDFLAHIARLSNLEESALNHIKTVNDNLQIVNMWLSAKDTNVLDNALITMEHLYKTGAVNIHLRHLMKERSYFEIVYFIDRIQGQPLNNAENDDKQRKEVEKMKFEISMGETDDHKRQLTFCNVDVQQNMFYSKALIYGQLKLLQIIEKIFLVLKTLERNGHPDYQLRDDHYDIHLQYGNAALPDFRDNQSVQLEHAVKTRTDSLEYIYQTLTDISDNWMKNLQESRKDCALLKLFSDRQIMILIILLRQSVSQNSIRTRFLKNLYSFKNGQNCIEEEQKLILQCLKHYLYSLRIQQFDDIDNVYQKHQIESGSNTELCLKKLSLFLQDLFRNGDELMQRRGVIDNSQQYLVNLNSTENNSNNLDINRFCILLNIFNNRLPSSFQILWCSIATIEDIELFYSRIRTFHHLIFVIMDIDKMNHRLREILLHQQDLLKRDQVEHGTVYYFSKELTTSRNGLRDFVIPAKYRIANQTYAQLRTLLQRDRLGLPNIQIICGKAGIGKTHRINTKYEDDNISCFSINDNLNLSSLISSFLVFDSNVGDVGPSIYFNISIHAPFEELNRALFSLFICGSLMDIQNGFIFSLPAEKPWKFIIEVPFSESCRLSIRENYNQILPLLSIIAPTNLEEVTSGNYQLFITEEEELVARCLKAYESRTIDRVAVTDHPVSFDELFDPNECRDCIYRCINNHAPELPRNKIVELSFTKFLYRRVRFFIGDFYPWNENLPELGSTAMEQMINEAKSLTNISFKNNIDPFRVYLVYDPGFSLHLLHNDWNRVPNKIKKLFNDKDPLTSPEYKGKDYLIECLAWLIDIPYAFFEEIMTKRKFILTENFAYKIFHVHERKLTKLALIIEGDTGVGKTFLLQFYSELLNAKYIRDRSQNSIMPRIVENTNQWLLDIILPMVENQPTLLNPFVQQVKRKILELDNQNNIDRGAEQQQDPEFLNEIKISLKNAKYDEDILQYIWKTILTISQDNHMENTSEFITKLHEYVTSQLSNFPLIEPSNELTKSLEITHSPTIQLSMEIFKEYLCRYRIKPSFYRLLLHPGITEEQVADFMHPIIQLARELPQIELVVFFDEVNTSSCLGLFKEMFMDGTMHGVRIPKHIFFTAAINPYTAPTDDSSEQIYRPFYNVHELPQALENLTVSYGILESKTMAYYISRKIAMFQVNSFASGGKSMPLDKFVQETLSNCILVAQEFCEQRLARNSVSQREIQRCFNLIDFFWKMRHDNEITNGQSSFVRDPNRCIALSLALIYYFRLPTKEHILQRNDHTMPSREDLVEVLSPFLSDFEETIQEELAAFVNTDNFVIPQGVAINQAVREHIFSIVVSVVTRTPLCIIGVPGQSKTLSFQIVLQNLQGPQLSPTSFCKRLPAIDPFFCLGSKYTRSDDIAYNFDRAIKREQQYEQNRVDTRCVVFLDEASLPDEKKMVLKVLHHYLDESKVAFIAIANKPFDAANANRMMCIYRSLPSEYDQKILAYGCLGLQMNHNQLDHIIYGLCQGYRRILQSSDIPNIFHDRDFIYMLRELRFELSNTHEEESSSVGEITPSSLLRALEDNFNGIKQYEFDKLVKIFFQAVEEQCPNFVLSTDNHYRDIPTILRQSMKLDSKRRKLYGRYKLVIDESEDESAVHLLFQSGILDSDPSRRSIFRMSDFPDDVDNELRNVEILSNIKLCMETGKTILMVNTGRIHGSLYDVFNQNFSIMASDDTRKIFSKVTIGPKTIDVVVHENFQCIVLVKRSELKDIPAPFLSRFQKYALSVTDFYSIYFRQLSPNDQIILKTVEEKVHSFIQHFGSQYFYGLNESTLYSCLLTLIKKDDNGQDYLTYIHRNYSQLTSPSKSFIEHNATDIRQSLLYFLISKLMQLVSSEAMIYKLPTFDDKIARLLCDNYFYQQEHFSINTFLQRMLSFSSYESENADLFPREDIIITTKLTISTRTSSFVTGLNNESKSELLTMHEKIDVINLAVVENSGILQERFNEYQRDYQKQVLIIVLDGRISQQRLHILLIRQMIDNSDKTCNIPNEIPRKFFIILIHSTRQELDHQLSSPSIFLHDWDYYYLDSSTSGSAFHLQKMLQILTSSFNTYENDEISPDKNLCDLQRLFDDCLWDFCSRIQIMLQDLPSDRFQNPLVYEFYQKQTSTLRRVQCLKEILQQSQQLEQRIVSIYYENVPTNQKSFDKTCKSIYQISKDILCGKRSNSLVDSLQSQIRTTFTNFVSNIFKFLVNDYGLETLVKLSSEDKSYRLLLNLIDYSSFPVSDNIEDDQPTTQGIFQLTSHYSCIPQTPLYHLFQQRIKILADEIKLTLRFHEQDIQVDQYHRAPTTTMEFINNDQTEYTSQQFRDRLIESITNNKILVEIISPSILQSYINDTVQMLCTVVEKSFDNNDLHQCQNTIEFITRWLSLTDENDSDMAADQSIWLLAHVYTFFEYNQHDLLSLYSACRITDQLDPTQSFYTRAFQDDQPTRSKIRLNLFQSMFYDLWRKLCDVCSSDHSINQWVHSYTFISKYYPSDKVLQHMQRVRVKGQIEFMNLAYFIFLNDKTPQPKELVLQLLTDTGLMQEDIDGQNINFGSSVCSRLLPIIINTIDKYLESKNIDNSTLMIDIQQWIISTLKSSNQSCEEEIKELFKFLNQSTSQLTLSMKQFLFDELTNILFKLRRQNQPGANRQNFDFWDRIRLLPIITDCIKDTNLSNYQLPYHPSIINENYQKQTLFDLFFFHLRRLANEEFVSSLLINKILMSNPPPVNDQRLLPLVEMIYKQLKDYFSIQLTALLFCEKDLNNPEQQQTNRILDKIIEQYLPFDAQSGVLTQYVQLFLSTIITKRSWNFLLNLLKSERFQLVNGVWSNKLHALLEMKHDSSINNHLQLCHQLQFTFSINNTLSIFPQLHQPYDELSKLIDQCIKTNDRTEQRWKPFSDWIQLKLTTNPPLINPTEIKVMLLLNIYYKYYCNNQLHLLDDLLPVIENTLQPLQEELCVFRAFLQPEQYMMGYPMGNNNIDRNHLNNLFKLDFVDEDELNIRHVFVNLLAMILLGGKENFLWTFTFEPLKLENTFGFGSTHHAIIKRDGVHYDCGCLFTENGDLIHFPNSQGNGGALSVPAVYVAYFSTYGAMAWHLLLFESSTQNLYGPILAKHAVDYTDVIGRIAGDSIRAKVCHFVRARLLSTFNLLSIHSNQDETCMLLNRCFEQMAQLTKPENIWIKPAYTRFEDKFQAEQEYQNHIFYPIYQQLDEYKKMISDIQLQSQVQKNLQDYVLQMTILIQFKHFKTELGNPKNAQLPLNILRNILDSFDFLKMTNSIYDLSQFYLLIHQTYTQLIERDELLNITLKELHERGQKRQKKSNRLNYQNQTNQHLKIIEKGIEAVNAYHRFADGLIRPGACDETKRFATISIETPISYLLTTDNYDEGNIIMRILSVLVDYHNNLLDLLAKEMNNNQENNNISLLKDLIDKLCGRELLLLQIVQENTGVITLNEQDCLSIERLARASLEIKEEYFTKSNVQLNFNFLYIQFYIIRSYLLVCRINYHNIEQKYQYYIPRSVIYPIEKKKSIYTLNDPQFNYLQERSLRKLYHEYNLLRKLVELLKHSQKDISAMNLHQFLETTEENNLIFQQIKHCDIGDFPLSDIDDVCQLYEQLINNFHTSIVDISPSLCVPIVDKQNDELDQLLNENLLQNVNDSKSIIQTLTEFLNDLKDIEDTLLQQSYRSLADVCKDLLIDNPIISMISNKIKCENYITVLIKLIEIQSKLQERTIEIEEMINTKWTDIIDEDSITTKDDARIFSRLMSSKTLDLSLLCTPIDDEQNIALDQSLDDNLAQSYSSRNAEELDAIMQNITHFLCTLIDIGDTLVQQPSRSLVDVCQKVPVESSIVSMIPNGIKCENYTPLVNKLMGVRSQLQIRYHIIIYDPGSLLCVPIDDEQKTVLDQSLNENLLQSYLEKTPQELDAIIETIADLLIKLKHIEATLLQRSSRSLVDVCQEESVENSIISMIPNEIKCENYTPLIKKLQDMRSQLEEESKKKKRDPAFVLSVPIDDEQKTAFDQSLEENLAQSYSSRKAEELDRIIQTITEFLDELKHIEDTLLEQPSRSLVDVCQEVPVQSSIVSMIPNEIKCENYTPLVNIFNDIQSRLRKRSNIIKDDPGSLLCVPIDDEQNTALCQSLNENLLQSYLEKTLQKLDAIIKTINDLLIELKDIEGTLLQQSSRSLADVCQEVSVESPIIAMIPNGIKCENYTPLVNIFKDIQSRFQEESEKKKRDPDFVLSVPIDDEQNTALNQSLNENLLQSYLEKTPQELDAIIETIADLLIKLKHIEATLLQQPSQSLADVCKEVSVENPIICMIPNGIKCENCIPLINKLQDMRSRLQDSSGPITSYKPLFELNIKSIPLTASILFEKTCEKQKQIKAFLSSIPNVIIFEIIYLDATRKRIKWRTENIYQRLKTAFDEKRYDFDQLVLVDQNQIFVDFLNENIDKALIRPSLEYHVIPKISLISLILKFKSQETEYLVTSKCQLSSMINHFITDHRLTFTSSNVLLGFFDELGSYIDEDKTMENIYRSSNSNTIRIEMIKYEDNSNHLSEVTLTLEEGTLKKLFHPITKWQQIDLWLQTTPANTIIDTYSFCDKEQRIIINEDESVSFTSSIIDGVSNEEIMNVTLSFETNKQHIRILKSSPVGDLLDKQHYLQQLKVQIPSYDCILVRKSTSNDQILTKDDLLQPIGKYSSDDHEEVHFQIAALIQIQQYATNRLIQLPISNRNLTIEQLIQMIPDRDEIYQYLASFTSYLILSNDEQLCRLSETKFYLVKEIETCLISINPSTEDGTQRELIHQRYTIFASIANLYHQNRDIITDHSLLFADAIVLSEDTPLRCFQQIESPVRFTLTKRRLEANITILNDEEREFALQFLCSPSIEIRRLAQLACQLFSVNQSFYQLFDSDDTELDDSLALFESVEKYDNVQFQLVSTADAKCVIKYAERSVIISANRTTTGSTVFEEAFDKFLIQRERIDMYELCLLDDPENPLEVDLSTTIDGIWEDFSQKPAIIPFQLRER